MPYANVRTTVQVLRDAENLYVRVESLSPAQHPEDLYPQEPDGNLFKQEYVELGIQPPSAGGKVYRLAGSPVAGGRYDALCALDARQRMSEDKSWNGTWEFVHAVTQEKGRWNLSGRVWTAWFKIPFADLGAPPPAVGEVWGFNVIRGRRPHDLLVWGDATNAADPAGLGQLAF